jgi:hypothetical protein
MPHAACRVSQVRMVPNSAIQFAAFETLRDSIPEDW